ncbi:MAG: FtsW/RodA/SpoVE family cell cycle protein [Fimbriimonadaceae bacterium]|nr:FtsW/RodA/SpoVE family cell cycle protein [Fimbriimonadaceae bacterium]
MKKTSGGDPILTILVIVATVLGLFAIWNSGYARSSGVLPKEFLYQAAFLIPAALVGFIASRLPIEKVKKGAWWLMALTIVALLLVEVPGIGKTINGATRWIDFRLFTVQPAEFAKFTSIIFMAMLLATYKPVKQKVCRNLAEKLDFQVVPKLVKMLPFLIVGFVVVVIEQEPDLATAMVIVVCAAAQLVLGGVRWKTLGVLAALALVAVGALVIKEPYRLDRISNHASRWSAENINSIGYQTTQAEIAFANGTWFGVGLGNGRAKHTLPAPTTDFVLATVGEEFGLVGSLIVIGLLGAITA